jgi:hypothetical protein
MEEACTNQSPSFQFGRAGNKWARRLVAGRNIMLTGLVCVVAQVGPATQQVESTDEMREDGMSFILFS